MTDEDGVADEAPQDSLSDMARELSLRAAHCRHRRLAYLLRRAQAEAEAVAKQSRQSSGSALRPDPGG